MEIFSNPPERVAPFLEAVREARAAFVLSPSLAAPRFEAVTRLDAALLATSQDGGSSIDGLRRSIQILYSLLTNDDDYDGGDPFVGFASAAFMALEEFLHHGKTEVEILAGMIPVKKKRRRG
jgi:hypothetical protein